ncbi:MAG: N-6 DNA methylase [Candidatus Pacebacteria bacterium]|nr:N-6 DNA methylase [Candidatus Paceibacterota bacterium]
MTTETQAIETYYASLVEKHKTGQAREHAYRPVLEHLIHTLDGSLKIVNDPSRSEHGNPDFVFLKGDMTVGYAETKDIGIDLQKTEKSAQMQRYLGYPNLILTDYLEFRFYRNGLAYEEPIRIATLRGGALTAHSEQFERLTSVLTDFLHGEAEQIKSGKRLAEIMGGKARRIRDNVLDLLVGEKQTDVQKVYETMQKMLVHDMTRESFADMYAQTLVYGLFVARYGDETHETFTRAEARDLVPTSNPFLAHFFDHIAGVNFEKRLSYIVDELCEVFRHANVKELMTQYFGTTLWGDEAEGPDPVIHFYEDFLKEYDPVLRKKMGAYYTPTPVVRFIVRAVDRILERDFGLAKGLADTSKHENGTHKVQVLDPATGTGTFVSAVIRSIYERILKTKQEGSWPAYVHRDLLPRIHAFELMMGPYTIAHLKLSMAFKKTGFSVFHRRLNIFLTNSLEESVPQDPMLGGLGLAESIAEESKEAAKIKNDTPIMVVVGNPPYSVSSTNKGAWIQELIKAYKVGLNEKKINLDDDYIKFIRYAEHFIEKSGTGIVAMITNNSFIDGITHRQMRKHLLETFDDLYILDLHGNAKKKETAPDGGKDENVFDIQQGVAIFIFVRKVKDKQGLGHVHHAELFGKRKEKFSILNSTNVDTVDWHEVPAVAPNYFFVPKDFSREGEYGSGFSVTDLMRVNSNGMETHKDDVTIQFTQDDIMAVVDSFRNYSEQEVKHKYKITKEGRDWKIKSAKRDIVDNEGAVRTVTYRPFDDRCTYYSHRSKGFVAYPRYEVLRHLLSENTALLIKRQCKRVFSYAFLVNKPCEACVFESAYAKNQVFPLYLYSDEGTKTPNLDKAIVQKIESITGEVSPEDILDYIYATLHSPTYREKYKEFLKIDFPRIPYPADAVSFAQLARLGGEFRALHLMQSPLLDTLVTSYPVTGENDVEKIVYKDGKVYINSDQYFGDVPALAWSFYIGGYQPAQKWLKDRKGRTLTAEDIDHYQRIIVALVETDRLMQEVEKLQSV